MAMEYPSRETLNEKLYRLGVTCGPNDPHLTSACTAEIMKLFLIYDPGRDPFPDIITDDDETEEEGPLAGSIESFDEAFELQVEP